MHEHHVVSLIVIEERDSGKMPIGLLTDRISSLRLFARDLDARTIPVSEVMFYDALRDTGRKVLAKAGAAAKVAKVESKLVLAEARAATVAHVIVRQARKLKADIIVIGTHGRRGLRRVLMTRQVRASRRFSASTAADARYS